MESFSMPGNVRETLGHDEQDTTFDTKLQYNVIGISWYEQKVFLVGRVEAVSLVSGVQAQPS